MKWKTRDGRVLDVKEMSDAHLMNAIAFMRRRLGIVNELDQLESDYYGSIDIASRLRGAKGLIVLLKGLEREEAERKESSKCVES